MRKLLRSFVACLQEAAELQTKNTSTALAADVHETKQAGDLNSALQPQQNSPAEGAELATHNTDPCTGKIHEQANTDTLVPSMSSSGSLSSDLGAPSMLEVTLNSLDLPESASAR